MRVLQSVLGPSTTLTVVRPQVLAVRCCTVPDVATLVRPSAAIEVWRPTPDDVDRISWGRPAKRKGTGSRGVPHRLNSEERVLYDLARRKGFLEIAGSGWRKQRSDAPLANTYRSWCDAAALACLVLHKGNPFDELVLDLSPLRAPGRFTEAAAFCLSLPGAEGGVIVEAGSSLSSELPTDAKGAEGAAGTVGAEGAEGEQSAADILAARAEAFATEPIYRLPSLAISWARPRPEAKALVGQRGQSARTRPGPPRPTPARPCLPWPAPAHPGPFWPVLARPNPPGSATYDGADGLFH